jgi:hypothetical protein
MARRTLIAVAPHLCNGIHRILGKQVNNSFLHRLIAANYPQLSHFVNIPPRHNRMTKYPPSGLPTKLGIVFIETMNAESLKLKRGIFF